MANIVEFVYKLTDKVSGTLTKVAQNTQQVHEQMERTKTKVNSLEGSLQRLALQYVSITGAIMGAKGFLKLGMDMEQTRAKFEVMLGSVERGNKMIADINKKANVTPFDNADLIKSTETLLAFDYNANKVLPTLDMLGNVAMGDRNKLSGLTLAFAQMSSTGRLMGQDLLQMINQGFNPLLIISQKTGKSMGALKKEMEQGRISADMVEEAFRTATSEGGQFYKMMDKMSEKGSGKVSTFLGDLRSKLTVLAEKLNPLIVKIMNFGIVLVNNFERIASVVWQIIAPIRALVVGFIEIFGWFNRNRGALVAFTVVAAVYKIAVLQASLALKGWTIASMLHYKWLLLVEFAQKLLNVTLLSNPITAVLVAVSLLVGALVMLRKRTREAADGMGEINRKSAEYANDERARLDMLFDKLRHTNPASKERNDLIKQLQEMYPDVLKNMNLEKATLEELEVAYNSIANAIDRKAKARAYEEALVELYKEQVRIKTEVENYASGVTSRTGASQAAYMLYNSKKAFGLSKELELVDSKIKNLRLQAQKNPELLGAQASGSEGLAEASLSGKTSTSISDLTGSGSRPTNITINLRNLIEYLNMYPANVKEGVGEVSNQLIEGLLRVVNSANRIAAQ